MSSWCLFFANFAPVRNSRKLSFTNISSPTVCHRLLTPLSLTVSAIFTQYITGLRGFVYPSKSDLRWQLALVSKTDTFLSRVPNYECKNSDFWDVILTNESRSDGRSGRIFTLQMFFLQWSMSIICGWFCAVILGTGHESQRKGA